MTESVSQKLRSAYHELRARSIAAKHGNPASSVKVIVVIGAAGSVETANFLSEMFKEAGSKTALFTYRSVEVDGKRHQSGLESVVEVKHIQQFLKSAKDGGVEYGIISLDSRTVDRYPLTGVDVEAVVLTGSGAPIFNPDHFNELANTLLAQKPKYIVLNRDDEQFESYQGYRAGRQTMTYGTHDDAEAKLTRAVLYKKGSDATLLIDHQTRLHLVTALVGKDNVCNIAAAATTAYLFGVALKAITEGGANVTPELITESEIL